MTLEISRGLKINHHHYETIACSTSTLKRSLLTETNETLGSDRYAPVSMIQSLCEKSPREYTSDFVHTQDLVVIIILETITGKC